MELIKENPEHWHPSSFGVGVARHRFIRGFIQVRTYIRNNFSARGHDQSCCWPVATGSSAGGCVKY